MRHPSEEWTPHRRIAAARRRLSNARHPNVTVRPAPADTVVEGYLAVPVRNALLALLTAFVLTAGCAAPRMTTTTSESAADLPASVGAALQTALDANRDRLGYPGAMVGVWTPDGAWFGVTGESGHGSGRSPQRDDHTRIGSLTKTFTVMALLQLVDRGEVSLADPIGRYIPGLPNGDTATLRDLAAMTSGIPNYSASAAFGEAWSADPAGTVFTAQQLVDFAKRQPPLFPAGTQMDYSNTNTVLLGMVIEKVTGQPMAQVYRSNLLEPLGMSQTSFPGSSPALPQPHLDGVTNQPDGTVRDATDWNPSWTSTAGGMVSTLDDMHAWTIALGTGSGLISEEMQRLREASTTSAIPPNDAELTYALGFFVDRGWWGHNGALPGYTTFAVYHPQRRTSVVVFVNSDITTSEQQTKPADLLAEDIIAALPS